MDSLKTALKGQYHAGMDMLKGAIEACPDEIWTGGVPPRSFWRLAYHTLYFTSFYLERRMEDFSPWEHHRDEVESDEHRERLDAKPYTREEMLAYWQLVDGRIDAQLDAIDLGSTESGFSW